LWRQFFEEGKQLYTDRIGFKFADWTYHITTHAAPPLAGNQGSPQGILAAY